MTAVLQPDTPSGAFRIRKPPATANPAPTSRRLDHVDLLRGLVMVIMVLDHVRAFFTNAHFDPTDLTRTDLALFGTRWITHFCAPVFVFLAGASAWIAGTRRTPGELSRFLLSRGLWLVFLEFTVITFGWYFTTELAIGLVAQVIWAIGASMVVLAGLVHLPRARGRRLRGGAGPGPQPVRRDRARAVRRPRAALERAPRARSARGAAGLPALPAGALGGGDGAGIRGRALRSSPRTPGRGGVLRSPEPSLVAAFVLLRALDGYGDAAHRLHEGGPALLLMSFLNTTKYPPSLLYLLMTLGPALVALAAFRRARGPLADVFVTFGRVPFLFYVAHLYLVHALAVAAGVAQGFPASAIRTVSRRLPEDYGFGLPVVYAVWLGVVALLYPVCRRYAEVKARSRAWWLSYL